MDLSPVAWIETLLDVVPLVAGASFLGDAFRRLTTASVPPRFVR